MIDAVGPDAGEAHRWDERYSHPKFVFGYRPNDFLVESEVLLRRRARVLVLGDGEGRNGVWLAQRGHQVTTVDWSPVGVAKARALAAERGVSIDAHVGDVLEWLTTDAAAGPWDGVVTIFLHLLPDERVELAQLVSDRLDPRGWLIQENYAPDQATLGTGGPSDPTRCASVEELIAEWPQLRLDARAKRRRIFEGMAHQGVGSVVQVLGQRRR